MAYWPKQAETGRNWPNEGNRGKLSSFDFYCKNVVETFRT